MSCEDVKPHTSEGTPACAWQQPTLSDCKLPHRFASFPSQHRISLLGIQLRTGAFCGNLACLDSPVLQATVT